MRPLQRLVTERIEELDLGSLRKVSAAAQDDGYELSHTVLSKICSGKYGMPKASTIEALAHVLRLPVAQVRHAAGLGEVGTEWVPPAEAHTLSYSDRRLVEAMIHRLAMGVATRD